MMEKEDDGFPIVDIDRVKDVGFLLGQLFAAVRVVNDKVKAQNGRLDRHSDEIKGMRVECARIVTALESLPCDERLRSCSAQQKLIVKLCGETREDSRWHTANKIIISVAVFSVCGTLIAAGVTGVIMLIGSL